MLEKCFVIMPFSTTNSHSEEDWTKHFEQFLKPLLEKLLKIPVCRSTALRTDILRDIIRDLIFSKLVIADITDLNPNVLWELGVRQSFQNGTLIIAENGIQIPFDISIKGVLKYPKSDNLNYEAEKIKFEDILALAISDWLEKPNITDSHVLETLSGRGTIYEIIFREDNIRKMDALLNELKYNKTVIAHYFRTIQKNNNSHLENNPEAPTQKLCICAIENLIVNRYLTCDNEFYIKMINYHAVINSINKQIDYWPINPQLVQNWFYKCVKNDYELIEDIDKNLNKEIENLKNSL